VRVIKRLLSSGGTRAAHATSVTASDVANLAEGCVRRGASVHATPLPLAACVKWQPTSCHVRAACPQRERGARRVSLQSRAGSRRLPKATPPAFMRVRQSCGSTHGEARIARWAAGARPVVGARAAWRALVPLHRLGRRWPRREGASPQRRWCVGPPGGSASEYPPPERCRLPQPVVGCGPRPAHAAGRDRRRPATARRASPTKTHRSVEWLPLSETPGPNPARRRRRGA